MREWMSLLFDLSLAASITVLAVLLLRLFLRLVSKKYLYLLWLAVFVRAVCPFSYSSPFSVFRLFSFMRTEGGQLTAALAPAQAAWLSSALGLEGTWSQAGGSAELAASAAAQAGAEAGQAAVLASAGHLLPAVLTAVWAAGVLLLLGWGLVSRLRLGRKVSLAVRAEEGIYETDQISTAFVLGFFRPRIYLPTGLSAKERDFVIRHERVHLRRHDHQLKLLAWVAAAVHWFNPLLWFALALLTRDMEMSCDEQVLDDVGEGQRESYGEALLSLAAPAGFPAGGPLAFGESSVKARIRNILKYKKKGRIAAAAALILVIVGIWFCLSNPSGQEAVSMIGGADGPTSIWLAGDAEDLTEEDRLAAFVQLWAAAAGNRNAEYVYESLSPELQARADELGIERTAAVDEDGKPVLSMGWSSPFLAGTPVIKLSEGTPAEAEITYPGLTSDMIWWVWKDNITLEPEGDSWQITGWERREFFEISSCEAFQEAYEDWTPDYMSSSFEDHSFAEELVLRDLAGQDPEYYEEHFYTPEAALEWTLHLEGGEAQTQMEEEGKALVTYRFQDGEIEVRMIQPGLSQGSDVWLPELM